MDFSPVDEIKSRLDILEVIGSYIRLAKAGRNYKARCPFHSERTPSFMVSPERQIWHCFGCGTGGDIFEFIKQIEGVEFGDALRILANRAGVVLRRQDPQVQTQRKRLYEICELAAKFFEKQLESAAGQRTHKYLLKERGLKPSIIKQWRLGWAPDQWRALIDFLSERGYKDNEILETGLTVKPETEETKTRNQELKTNYDRFRSRIMFPLFDIQGQIVGFAGRIFGHQDAEAGKYINTPQTILYDKSQLLYGLNFAKLELRKQDACIFVEGNLDVIMSHQAGAPNTVATSGTALTEGHLRVIKRYTDNLLFAFDTDTAGESATRRSIDLALENDFNVKIVKIKEKDPADLIKQDPRLWIEALKNSVSVLDYYFLTTFAKYPSTSTSATSSVPNDSGQVKAEDKKQIAKTLLPLLKRISNQIEKAHWIGELAKRLKIDEKILYQEMQKINEEPLRSSNDTSQKKEGVTLINQEKQSRAAGLEERILSLALIFPHCLPNLDKSPKEIFPDEKTAEIMERLMKIGKEHDEKEKCLKILKGELSDELCKKVDYLSLKAEQFPIEEKTAAEEITQCIKELKMMQLREGMTALGFEIQEAQTKKDAKKLKENMERFKELSNKLMELSQ